MAAVPESPGGGGHPTRAAVILPFVKPKKRLAFGDARGERAAAARLAEAVGLAASIGLTVVHTAIHPLRERRPATLLGEGQVETIRRALKEQAVTLAIVDAGLTPVQQRNLEKAWECKVIDRTGLILEIFGERAQTREGALQVELAHLEYQRTRLVRSWTHLERQRGGFGFLGGPGESQLEIDRRLIGERIARLRRELEEVRRTRALHRTARQRVPYPIVALIGYTNAGKSTLFNALTGAGVYAQDQLFATLDPTMRAVRLPSGRSCILSDTVGFISDLPTQLIAAFRATLEEIASASVILHIRDIAHPDSAAQRADVLAVMEEMAEGPQPTLDPGWRDRMIEVLNKADLLGGVAQVACRAPHAIAVSALTGEGLEALRCAIDERLAQGLETIEVTVPPTAGAKLAWLYRHGEVLAREEGEEGIRLRIRLSPAARARFEAEWA